MQMEHTNALISRRDFLIFLVFLGNSQQQVERHIPKDSARSAEESELNMMAYNRFDDAVTDDDCATGEETDDD